MAWQGECFIGGLRKEHEKNIDEIMSINVVNNYHNKLKAFGRAGSGAGSGVRAAVGPQVEQTWSLPAWTGVSG